MDGSSIDCFSALWTNIFTIGAEPVFVSRVAGGASKERASIEGRVAGTSDDDGDEEGLNESFFVGAGTGWPIRIGPVSDAGFKSVSHVGFAEPISQCQHVGSTVQMSYVSCQMHSHAGSAV